MAISVLCRRFIEPSCVNIERFRSVERSLRSLIVGIRILLSFRLRERELRTYSKIGATRHAIFCLQGMEVAIIVISAMTLSLLAGALTRSIAPEMLSKLLN